MVRQTLVKIINPISAIIQNDYFAVIANSMQYPDKMHLPNCLKPFYSRYEVTAVWLNF